MHVLRADVTLRRRDLLDVTFAAHVVAPEIGFPHCGRPKLRAYTVAAGAFASPSSSPRFLARYAETLARFMHRSEQ